MDLCVLNRFSALFVVFELCQEKKPSGRVGPLPAPYLPYAFFLPATTQVFGHIPAVHTAAQPIQRGSAIGLLQRYLIGLIWAPKRHSYKIGFLIKPRRQRSLHLLPFAGFHLLYLPIKCLVSPPPVKPELYDFLFK